MYFAQIGFAQQKTVSGTVSDVSGLPLPGVSVVIKGTSTGTQTDFDGKYTIDVLTNQVLVFSFIGTKTQEIAVTSDVINVNMLDDVQQMDEVVVIGYGVQKRKDVTGAISSISGSAIQGLVTPSFESQLAGRAAGVQVTTASFGNLRLQQFENNPKAVNYYTGFKDVGHLRFFFYCLGPAAFHL